MKTLIIIATIFLGFTLADAYCTNSWVCDGEGNCGYMDICDNAIDMPSMNLPPLPSLPSIEMQPLPSLQLPPLGTSYCEYMQVNGRWRNVCR